MALAKAVQGARHTPQVITWLDDEGDPVTLSGATLTARLHREATGDASDVDGTLTITNGAAGEFEWAYGEDDVAVPGVFYVQFKASFGGVLDITYPERWEVVEAL